MRGIILSISAVSFSLYSCSQDIPAGKVPSVVQNTVQAQFIDATKIEWEKKNHLYEAEFYIDSTEYTVHIDPAGKIVMYKKDIRKNELPAVITSAISQEYAGYKLDDAEMLEKDGITYYQIELEGKGKKEEQLVFSADGKKVQHIIYMK